MTGTEVALWYWRYHSIEYDIWDTEEEAAGIAVGMIDNGGGAPAGVQFPDGRLIAREDWPAFAEAERRRDQAEADAAARKPPPRPKRKIAAPFGGGELEIDANEPSWLGVTR